MKNHLYIERCHSLAKAGRALIVSCCMLATCYTSAAVATEIQGTVVQASDIATSEAFGYSVSISGQQAAVGAWFDDGAVYILELNPATNAWDEVQIIRTPDVALGRGNFGFSTWMDGDQLIVGAPNVLLSAPLSTTGYAFIYERSSDDSLWELVSSIEGATADPGAFSPPGSLGREVVIEQGRAFISTQADDGTSSVLVYEKNPISGAWALADTITITGENGSGESVIDFDITALALEGNRLVVGVNETEDDGDDNFAAEIFEFNTATGNWNASDRIDLFSGVISSDLGPSSNFFGLALDMNRLLVSGGAGSFLFQQNGEGGQWVQDPNFTQDVAVESTERLSSDLEGSRVLLTYAGTGGGVVFEQDATTGRWAESSTLSIAALSGTPMTITAADLQGDTVILGIPYIDSFTGAVITFSLDDPDSDGVRSADDNCPADFNPTQANFDEDLLGDVCDLDDDNDGVDDDADAFPLDPTQQNALPTGSGSEKPSTPFPAWPFGFDIALGVDFRWPAVADATYYVVEVQHNGMIRAYEPSLPAVTACTDNQCTYIKSDAARDGSNRWRLRAGNDVGLSPWSEWTEFTVGQSASSSGGPAFSQLPAVPVPQRPTGDGNTEGDDFVWAAVTGVLYYTVEVQHNGEIRAYEPSLAASVACSLGVCRYTKSDAARIGENRWRLRARNDVGASNWSNWQDFTVENLRPSTVAFIPAAPTPSAPAASALQVDDYRWSEVTGATIYSVEIQHNGIVRGYADFLSSTDVCDATGCVFNKPDAALLGENRWRVRSGNENGFSDWSDWLVFSRTVSP